eukprot:g5445.t1
MASPSDLPPGWGSQVHDGRVLYVDHINKVTTYEKPTAPLPPGWTAKATSSGKVYYENHITKSTTWDRPVAPAGGGQVCSVSAKDTPSVSRPAKKEPPLPPGWTAKATSAGKVYYENHITKSTTWDRPVAPAGGSDGCSVSAKDTPSVSRPAKKEPPLPPGWTAKATSAGKVYYENHITKSTTWDRPVAPAGGSDESSVNSKETPSASSTAKKEPPLPPGWTIETTPDGKVYYANEHTKATQWDRPSPPQLPPRETSKPCAPRKDATPVGGGGKSEPPVPSYEAHMQTGVTPPASGQSTHQPAPAPPFYHQHHQQGPPAYRQQVTPPGVPPPHVVYPAPPVFQIVRPIMHAPQPPPVWVPPFGGVGNVNPGNGGSGDLSTKLGKMLVKKGVEAVAEAGVDAMVAGVDSVASEFFG